MGRGRQALHPRADGLARGEASRRPVQLWPPLARCGPAVLSRLLRCPVRAALGHSLRRRGCRRAEHTCRGGFVACLLRAQVDGLRTFARCTEQPRGHFDSARLRLCGPRGRRRRGGGRDFQVGRLDKLAAARGRLLGRRHLGRTSADLQGRALGQLPGRAPRGGRHLAVRPRSAPPHPRGLEAPGRSRRPPRWPRRRRWPADVACCCRARGCPGSRRHLHAGGRCLGSLGRGHGAARTKPPRCRQDFARIR
mmetsp:Transcript_61996/g.202226  ORF Transcript_61996/g.202226 Transcript_61996/m.202226 type:complete len:251 (-) Transcript_61996:500-1252(-)